MERLMSKIYSSRFIFLKNNKSKTKLNLKRIVLQKVKLRREQLIRKEQLRMQNKIPLPKPGNAERRNQNKKPQAKPKLPGMQNKVQQNEVQQKEVRQEKAKQNNNEEELSPEIVELRKTDRWKSMYMRNLQSKDAIKGGEKYKEKVYCELIDRLASPPVDQNNILASFSGFANDNFKYTND